MQYLDHKHFTITSKVTECQVKSGFAIKYTQGDSDVISFHIHSFISPQNVIAKKEYKKQNLTKLN